MNKKAFTLAEILAVLIILGVVATLTIPSALHRTSERANKTKIRKAMAVYETAVEKMIVENNIPRNEASLTAFVLGQNNDCAPAREYFKMNSLETPGNNCRFRASDGLWWDVTDITNTLISFKNDAEHQDLSWVTASGDEYKAFKFVTRFDKNAIIRINDNGYNDTFSTKTLKYKWEQANLATTDVPYKGAVEKVQAYLNNEIYSPNPIARYSDPCKDGTPRKSCTRPCRTGWFNASGNDGFCSYDENGCEAVIGINCTNGHCMRNTFIKSDKNCNYKWYSYDCDENMEYCYSGDAFVWDNKTQTNKLAGWHCGTTSGMWAYHCKNKNACAFCNLGEDCNNQKREQAINNDGTPRFETNESGEQVPVMCYLFE